MDSRSSTNGSATAGHLLHAAFNGNACELKQAVVAAAHDGRGVLSIQCDITKLAIQHPAAAQRLMHDDIAVGQAVLHHVTKVLQQMGGQASQIRVQLRPVNMPGLLCDKLSDVYYALQPDSSNDIVVLQGLVTSLGPVLTTVYSRMLTCRACGETSQLLAGHYSSTPTCCNESCTSHNCTEVTEAKQVQSCQTVGLRVADAAGARDLPLRFLDDDLVGAFTLGQHLEVVARVSWLAAKPLPGAQMRPALQFRVLNATASTMPVRRAVSSRCRPGVLAEAALASEPKPLQGVVDLLVAALGRESRAATVGWETWVGMLLSACCIGEPPRQSKTVQGELYRCQVNLCWLFDGSPAFARLIRRAAELLAPAHRQIGATTQLRPSVTSGTSGAMIHAGALHELSEGLMLSADLATLTKQQLTTLEHFLAHVHTRGADGAPPQPNTATCWMLMDTSAHEAGATPAAELPLDAASRQLGCKLLHRVDLVLGQGRQGRADGRIESVCDELLNATSCESASAARRAAVATALQEHLVRASACPPPSMSEEAMDLLQSYYMSARSAAPEKGVSEASMAVLSSLVRLSMASARLRLQEDVLPFDALLAIRLVEESACVGSGWTRPQLLGSPLMEQADGMRLDAYVDLLEAAVMTQPATTEKAVSMDFVEE